MRNTIKKILKENEFEWVTNQVDLPLNEIKKLSNQYETILKLKIKLEQYLVGKEGMEDIDYSDRRINDDNHLMKYRNQYIIEQIREIYNEVNNVEGSVLDLSSSLDHLEFLITGIDTTENDEY